MRPSRSALLLAAMCLAGLAAPAPADVVINMPPPPASSRPVTTLPSAEYDNYEPPATPGQIALGRYASARYGPYDTYASPGLYSRYGGWYGYPYASYPPYSYYSYPYYGYYPYYGWSFVKFRRPHIHLHIGKPRKFTPPAINCDV